MNSPSFTTVDTKNGWTIFQKKSKSTTAWSSVGKVEGDAALSLIAKTEQAGGYLHEIPGTWVAIPTGFDLQVHLRFPGQPQKETLAGGIESAFIGGYDGVLTMPNTSPFLDEPEVLKQAIKDCEKKSGAIQVLFTASATRGMQGQEATDIAALAKAGAAAITDDGWGVKSDAAQEAIFEACATADILFQQHAEMPGHKGVTPKSAFQQREGLPEYPRLAESEMIRRDLAILRRHKKARYHVLHVSTRESIAEIRGAKAEGLRVTAEVTPHHLIFSNQDIPPGTDPLSTNYKMNPPLFDPEDRAALRAALRDGTIDCVSTDHAPHEAELKSKGWVLSPFGTRGMETALSALLTLVHAGELSLERLVEVFSLAPRKILGNKAPPKGILFVDPEKKFTVGEQDLPGISKNSCFLGTTLHGRWEIRAEADHIFHRKS